MKNKARGTLCKDGIARAIMRMKPPRKERTIASKDERIVESGSLEKTMEREDHFTRPMR